MTINLGSEQDDQPGGRGTIRGLDVKSDVRSGGVALIVVINQHIYTA